MSFALHYSILIATLRLHLILFTLHYIELSGREINFAINYISVIVKIVFRI